MGGIHQSGGAQGGYGVPEGQAETSYRVIIAASDGSGVRGGYYPVVIRARMSSAICW
jgi:hypothetical protein